MEDTSADYYELLQISPNAEPETIHRVYRLLAQQFHPDNAATGNEARFRVIQEAYKTLSDPARRAEYDLVYHKHRKDRWKLVSDGVEAETDVELERLVRLTLLEVLYTRRRTEPGEPGVFMLDLEAVLGRPREHLEFTVWFLVQKNFVRRADDSKLTITADGVEYLEENYRATVQRRRLAAKNP
jgi:curved DNA-binding protein CbpA